MKIRAIILIYLKGVRTQISARREADRRVERRARALGGDGVVAGRIARVPGG